MTVVTLHAGPLAAETGLLGEKVEQKAWEKASAWLREMGAPDGNEQ